MTSKDAETPDGASGSRWEPTDAGTADDGTAEDATVTDQGAVPPPPADDDTTATRNRWRPSRTLSIAAAAAIAGLAIGGAGGWAAGNAGHDDDHRMRPTMVGFQGGYGDRDGDGRMPGGPGMPGGGQPGGPGGPGIIPGQPQLQGQGSDEESDGDGPDDSGSTEQQS